MIYEDRITIASFGKKLSICYKYERRVKKAHITWFFHDYNSDFLFLLSILGIYWEMVLQTL